jgi:hypothetical protein
MVVTPDMASDWLSYRNHPLNRKLSKAIAGKYQKDMEAVPSRWRETPEPMIFDTEGYIISAQHRLKAVANSGTTQRFLVCPNQSRDIFDVVDQGYKRVPAHVLNVPNATLVAGAARYLAALADGDRWSMPRFARVTTPEIVAVVRDWPELGWYGTEVTNVRLRTFIPGSAHLAIVAQASRTEHIGRIDSWLDGLLTGANLAETDPRNQLRNRFLLSHGTLSGTKNRDAVYSLIAKAWNAHAEDRVLPVLRHMTTETLAQVAGLVHERNEAA